MLTAGFNHVATITSDTARLLEFYEAVFEVTFDRAEHGEGPNGEKTSLTIFHVGPSAEMNVFEIEGNTEADRQVPMFGRGRIDHLALQAESIEAFETIRERLIDRGAADRFVTDFGPVLSLFFRDPDGLECEVCVPNPDAEPGVINPPGTPAARYADDQ